MTYEMKKHVDLIEGKSELFLALSFILCVGSIILTGGVPIDFVSVCIVLGIVWSLLVIQYWKKGGIPWFISSVLFCTLSLMIIPVAYSIEIRRVLHELSALFIMCSTFFSILNIRKRRRTVPKR